MATLGIKGFYRLKKGGVSKPSPKRSTAGKSKAAVAAFESALDPEQVQIHGSDDGKAALVAASEEEEEKLRQFDLDMRYGPCIGLSRVERWDRADAMGLNPPPEVEAILLKLSYSAADCLWGRRI